jgi:ribosomal protein L11 methyltransferase
VVKSVDQLLLVKVHSQCFDSIKRKLYITPLRGYFFNSKIVSLPEVYIQIEFHSFSPEQSGIIIAGLSEIGFGGFEENENSLKAFIKDSDFAEAALQSILEPLQLSYTKTVIPETNWNQVWESNFQPVIVEGFVAIRAEFHPPVSNVTHEIIITPKMSFGTGHHATTHMMILQMRELDFKNKNVFDFGTGTGVLAIFAEKLGASSVLAMDIDEWSIANAQENAGVNHCHKIQIVKAGKPDPNTRFDIILANINKNVILENFAGLCGMLSKQGILMVSGLLREDAIDLLSIANQQNVKITQQISQDGWICLRLNH